MTKAEIIKKVEKYNEWKDLIEEAKKELEIIENEIKEEMLERELEELAADQYIIRYTNVLSNRFDTTNFKKTYAELYKAFTKQIASKRFTLSA